MAKRKASKSCSWDNPPVWFGVLVVLVGVWFILEDLNILRTGITLWPVVITLLGIKLWAKAK